MKAKISSKLSGTIILPSVSRKSLQAGQEFELTEDQYWNEDIQIAVRKGWISCSHNPKLPRKIKVTNISLGSVSIPNVGVLRSGRSIDIKLSDSRSGEIRRLEEMGKIHVGDHQTRIFPDQEPQFIVHDPADRMLEPEDEKPVKEKAEKKIKTPKKNNKIIKDKHAELIIDTSSSAEEKDDGINWVDSEQDTKRISEHPILGKKK